MIFERNNLIDNLFIEGFFIAMMCEEIYSNGFSCLGILHSNN